MTEPKHAPFRGKYFTIDAGDVGSEAYDDTYVRHVLAERDALRAACQKALATIRDEWEGTSSLEQYTAELVSALALSKGQPDA